MNAPPPPSDSIAWEKEFAPRISRAYIVSVALLYAAWVGFLTLIAVNRWFGSSQ